MARSLEKCCEKGTKIHSQKQWNRRDLIHPDLIVLHSTESRPGSGSAVSHYLAAPKTLADVHVLIDTNGHKYALVPGKRKAWHVAGYNPRAVGIEQVGYASQRRWPLRQLKAVAKQIACWSHHKGISIRDARRSLRNGIVTHHALGAAGGGHHDPGPHYPFRRVLLMARWYKLRGCV